MVSKGIVQKIIDENHAEIVVTRQSACGDNCASCSGCSKPTYKAVAVAKNPVGAQVGDVVNVKSETLTVIKGAAFVYILPLILFFVFYAVSSQFLQSEGICGAIGVVGFAIGIYFAGLYSKKMGKQQEVGLEIFK
ncbi:MAG: SoxR reducing system RseC family protein [Clostridia bacterium]